jgi:hypothetical protein
MTTTAARAMPRTAVEWEEVMGRIIARTAVDLHRKILFAGVIPSQRKHPHPMIQFLRRFQRGRDRFIDAQDGIKRDDSAAFYRPAGYKLFI